MHQAGLILILLFFFSNFANAEDTQLFPLGNKMLKEQGIELPLPFGISAVFSRISDKTKITKMTLPMIGELKNFKISNSESETDAYNIRADLWLLPFMNIYALAGYLDGLAKTTIDIGDVIPLTNSEFEIETEYHGTTLGAGTTFVVGTTSGWVVSLDMNYSETKVNLVEGDVTSYMIAPRILYSMKSHGFPLTAGVGVPYFNNTQTIRSKISGENARRETFLYVDIENEKNWNIVLTASFELDKHLQLNSEIGFYDRKSFSLVLVHRI